MPNRIPFKAPSNTSLQDFQPKKMEVFASEKTVQQFERMTGKPVVYANHYSEDNIIQRQAEHNA